MINDITAIIVTFNRKELLKECVNALINQNNKCDILIIDNNSSDGTYDYIKDLLINEEINYFNTGSNLGGAGGFNFGIKKAYEMGYDYFWIMDDDCIVHENTLTKLLEADKKFNGNYGFLSSKVLWKDGSICKMNIPKRKFSCWLKDFEKNYQKIAMASFVSLFLKREIVKEYGLPIKDFFIWTDDWEYTRRISRKLNCYYISDSIVTHKSKSNVGADISTVEDDRIERFKYLYRNDVVLYRREGWKGYILFALRIAKHVLKIIKSSRVNKKIRIKIMFEAIKEGKRFHPQIEYVNNIENKELS